MSTRPRSLVSNSVGSIIASGMLIFSTVLIPAALARTLTRAEFDTYSVVLAALPLILLLPQSMRTVGASQLALAVAKYGAGSAMGGYGRFVAIVSAAHVALSALGIEVYVRLGHAGGDAATLRGGLYALLVYSAGLLAAGWAIAPAAAQRDFRPDNIAKSWPSLAQLAGVGTIWAMGSEHPLAWIFAVYAASSWSIAILLSAVSRRRAAGAPAPAGPAPSGLFQDLTRGLRGVLWWNLTAFLATTATVMIVAIGHRAYIVPFSIATSLLGIVSAAMVAVSGPIAVHASAFLGQPPQARRRLFLLANTLFQAYILGTAFVIVVAPVALYALWLTPELAGEVKTLSVQLLPATVLRLLTMCFTIFVMSAGRQHSLWLSPMVEAVLSVAGSLLLGHWLGIAGIPIALAFSAAVRLVLTVVHDERINRGALGLDRGDVLLSAWSLARSARW